ncbi:MAG TPA: hypothetical protein VMS96_01625 [Terriglobales bacterium]|nr:hypothetical protein [Terriglobales bacterium]
MKAIKTMVAVMAAAGLVMAQTPASKPKAPASQTVSGTAAPATKAAPAQKPAAAAKPAGTAAAAPAKTQAKPAKKAAVSAVAKPSAAKPAVQAAAKAPAGKRDPFVNPVVRAAGGPGGPMCATGKRCLMVNEMVLHGIVKTTSGMIAVVSNQANRTYFLKENDSVFNGSVVKITADSVIFRETAVDNMGRETSREVVKRVSAPTV